MKKRNLLIAAGVVAAGVCIWLIARPSKGPKVLLETAPISHITIRNSVTATGTVEPVTQVEVGTQVSGIIDKLYADYNDQVKAGQLIAEMDKVTLQAELESAQAQLASSKTEYEYQTKNYARTKTLHEKQLVSDAEYDQAFYLYETARNAYEQSQAAMVKVKRNLGYATITSPIDGRVGHSQFHVGSLVNPASGVLVEVVQLDPIRIAFALEEGAFATKAGQHADISAMKQAWQTFIDSNGQRVSGELTSVDNRVDPRTASVMLRAEFANPRHQLLPGGSVNVTLRPASEQPVLTLPAAAVQQNGDGFFAWVVNADGKAEMRPLKVAGQIGQQFRITSGVKPGERAITDGAQRVQPGAAVQILN